MTSSLLPLLQVGAAAGSTGRSDLPLSFWLAIGLCALWIAFVVWVLWRYDDELTGPVARPDKPDRRPQRRLAEQPPTWKELW